MIKAGRSTRLLLWIVAIWVVLAVLFVDTAPPRSMTYGAMHVMKRRILRYAAANGMLPTSLDQLLPIEGYGNEVMDAWGRPILWQVEGGQVILTSYGRDGVPGGSGENADMIGVFQVKTASGQWADEFCAWRVDPLAAPAVTGNLP